MPTDEAKLNELLGLGSSPTRAGGPCDRNRQLSTKSNGDMDHRPSGQHRLLRVAQAPALDHHRSAALAMGSSSLMTSHQLGSFASSSHQGCRS